MNTDKEQMWQAYVDGELSACEAAQFEALLTEAERARLASEMRFDRALSERLREGGACPVAAWARARALAVGSTAAPAEPHTRRWIAAGVTLAAAAVIAFLLSGLPIGPESVRNSDVVHAAATMDELRQASETAPGWENAAAFLKEKGIRLSLEDHAAVLKMMLPHQPIEIVGARQETVMGTEVTELLVACCDKPVKVILVPSDSRAARSIGDIAASKTSDIQATRNLDGYVAAVVAKHPSHGLVNLFASNVP